MTVWQYDRLRMRRTASLSTGEGFDLVSYSSAIESPDQMKFVDDEDSQFGESMTRAAKQMKAMALEQVDGNYLVSALPFPRRLPSGDPEEKYIGYLPHSGQ